MTIVRGRPPNYDDIVRVVGKPPESAIFTWGETCYVPGLKPGDEVDPEVLAHEAVHTHQQALVGGPEQWWRRWLASPAFRITQELEACRAQYQFACDRGISRQVRRAFARDLATMMASPMYGRMISRRQALEVITA